MHSTPQPPTAAGEHFADAERILAALPLVKRGDERDRHVQIALVHAVLEIVDLSLPNSRVQQSLDIAGQIADRRKAVAPRCSLQLVCGPTELVEMRSPEQPLERFHAPW